MSTEIKPAAVMVRIRRDLATEIRQIAQREAERQSTILRRLLRSGLAAGRRSAQEA